MLGFGRKKKLNDNLIAEAVKALKSIYDPEIPVNIYDLGLIYDIQVEHKDKINIKMTLTAPGCPVAQTFPKTVEDTVKNHTGVKEVWVELVWEPAWDQSRMSDAAKLQLGLI